MRIYFTFKNNQIIIKYIYKTLIFLVMFKNKSWIKRKLRLDACLILKKV
jgi:hypothetical protein